MKEWNFNKGSHKRFHHYVTEQMPEVLKVPKIVRAMAKHGFMGLTLFREALTPGLGPHLILVPRLQDAQGQRKRGLTPR